jgi:hypothetical protein
MHNGHEVPYGHPIPREEAVTDRLETLRAEQRAFDAVLEDMLERHAGEFAVFHDGEPAGFFSTYDDAYGFALDRFGLDTVFLVSEVKRRRPEVTSIAWDLGVMFGET